MVKWYVGASFLFHPYFNNHTVTIMTMVQGVMQSVSSKHKLNTRINAEAELVAVGDASVYILWTVIFT